ncbi:uncharacterized protein LOC130785475 [Actinidia eriantha]|uniref:uncharacterized protein LOC130785475 n=1 Tax=Actinidia eriantha TaxID=165200 RepID=UPI00258B9C70|nr:uncharacterized protein LOC130785475 [Actinidia eriantha]
MSRGSAIYSAALLVAIVSIFVAPTLAQIWGGQGELPGAGSDCMDSIRGIEGCTQTFMTLLRAQIQQIATCCRIVLNASDNCWPKMYPYDSPFPLFVKGYCKTQGQSMTPPSPTNVRANKLN